MNKIYNVLMMHLFENFDDKTTPRLVGWYPTLEEADNAVMNFAPWDCLYNYALIEEVGSGFHAGCFGKVVGFYKANWNERVENQPNQPTVEKMDLPDVNRFRLTVGHTMG